ncbi:YbaY family lipoprotein [Cupriavidus basilensis]|uniref:YbaY family lipoprotein n=1 Tax=Cupriavidus basilensis TaxID=68895 RepID=UPI0020A649BE|nr:YbaY family lipoprotein [Cupriavidus basilensis]MCP3018578.1 YbaY family lipoprotein [Cupriavidus basilensis]
MNLRTDKTMWKNPVRQTLAAFAATLALPALAGIVTGTATYRERIALPPDAVFEVTLQDVSRAGAPALVIGRSTLDPAGQPPFHFGVAYQDQAIEPGHRYAVRAVVRQHGRLLFTTDTHVPALDGNNAPLQLQLVSASRGKEKPSEKAAAQVPDSPLRGTYWKLTRLGDMPVSVAERQREPHLILATHEARLSGNGGCNSLMGGYEADGDRLRFKGLAGTMMACAQGMAQETQFLHALETVRRYRIAGRQLDLLGADNAVVASFESVALR